MSLKEQIDKSIKEAMLAQKKGELNGLRSIKSMILLAQTKGGGSVELSPEDEILILKKAAKQRKDSIQIYEDQGRADLAEVEKLELSVIERFLPAQMSDEEAEKLVAEVISELQVSGMQDFGKVMPVAINKANGMVDNKLIADLIKKHLSS